jgi:hypothetical protein
VIIILGVCVLRPKTAPSSQDAGPMGVNPMALLGQEGAQKDYYYYYYYTIFGNTQRSCMYIHSFIHPSIQ